MISQREERSLRAFLDDEPPILPTHVWYAVMSEVPATRQRRHVGALTRAFEGRSTVRLLAVAILLVLLGAALALGAGALWMRLFAQPRPLPNAEVALEAGVYVIDRPFPVRVALDVPAGWASIEATQGKASLRRDRKTGPTIVLTLADTLYLDACDPDQGLQPRVGPAPVDLVAALARTKTIIPDAPSSALLGPYSAEHVSIRAPTGPASCTTHPDEPTYQLWYGLGIWPGERADVWARIVDDRRLVVALTVPPGTTPADVTEAESILASIRLGDDVPTLEPTQQPAPTTAPADTEPFSPILPGVPTGAFGELVIPVYPDGAGPRATPLPGRFVLALAPPTGWTGTTHGVATPDGTASIETWSIRAMHADPCHWRTSEVNLLGASLGDLAAALAGGWSSDAGSGAPVVSLTSDAPWLSDTARLIDLSAPEDIDPMACDGGRIVAWVDRDGTERSLRPGERIRLRIPDLHPGVVVVAFASAGATSATLEASGNAADSVWVGDATPFSGP